jgi:hypothetical protein
MVPPAPVVRAGEDADTRRVLLSANRFSRSSRSGHQRSGPQRSWSQRSGQLSRAIGISRVLCIMGIVYVHAWTGLYGPSLSALADTPQGLLRWGLIELLGRSSVPLLSMISGWLVGPSLARRGWRRFLAGKVRAVLVPMVAWNLIAIVVVSGAALAGWLYAPIPRR